MDEITVSINQERKGLVFKHVEYLISSKRFKAQVRYSRFISTYYCKTKKNIYMLWLFFKKVNRRYNDFLALNDLLLSVYPYRLIPRLPPPKVKALVAGVDSTIVDDRHKALKRWINFLACHPVICQDPMIEVSSTRRCYIVIVQDSHHCLLQLNIIGISTTGRLVF